uniref:TadE/TadG family type IV pilus assembly protein n=1 Tax=Nocardioides psychrotolerans TaxID=1005945 RepID=UPI003137A175
MTRQARRTSARRRRRDERGSVAIEAAIGVPAFGLFVAMIILGGRVEIAKQSVDAAAYEAARAASIERTQSEAITSGKSA